MSVSSIVGRAVVMGAAILCTAAAAQAQIRVPATWGRRASVLAFARLERDCISSLEERFMLTIEDGRLQARLTRATSFRHDPLPYPMDLSGALGDLSDTSGWPDPPPPPPSRGPAPPRPPLDPAIERAFWVNWQREWHIAYARDHAHRRVVPVSDGWLIAFNAGEYGGSLWWYPRVAGPGRLLWRGSMTWLEPLGDEVVAIGGIAHQGLAIGNVLWLHHGDDGWTVRRKATLQHSPSVIVRERTGAIAVATFKSVERIGPDGVDVLFRAELPDAPSSIVAAENGEFALGMRVYTYVLRPGPDGYHAEIYVPPGCDLRRVGWLCSCASRG